MTHRREAMKPPRAIALTAKKPLKGRPGRWLRSESERERNHQAEADFHLRPVEWDSHRIAIFNMEIFAPPRAPSNTTRARRIHASPVGRRMLPRVGRFRYFFVSFCPVRGTTVTDALQS
jgi:hypothetical protein